MLHVRARHIERRITDVACGDRCRAATVTQTALDDSARRPPAILQRRPALLYDLSVVGKLTNGRYGVGTQTTDQLFGPSAPPLVIPEFQRGYAWGPDEIDELVDDLFGSDGAWVHAPDVDAYFLGSLVVAEAGGEVRVLDGQQRLTTLSLLLAVLSARVPEGRAPGEYGLSHRLFTGRWGEAPRPRIQLQREDVLAYREALEDPSKCAVGRTAHGRSAITRATRTLDELVDEIVIRHAPMSPDRIIASMITRVLYGTELVVITASNESIAFRLFETLNDRGLPLSAADLIKNKLFARAGSQIPAVRECWEHVVLLVGSDEILHFLRHFWIAREGRSISKHRLYETCADTLDAASAVGAVALARELEEAAATYRGITRPHKEPVQWAPGTCAALDRLSQLRARGCRAALLSCAQHAPNEFEWFAQVCESAVIRHTIVGARNPNQLERAYAEVCHALKAGTDLRAAVASALGPVVPSDTAFQAAFAALVIPHTSTATRVLLLRLNSCEATGEQKIEGPRDVHIEHILPQHPSAAALSESDVTKEEATDLAASIGNMTLLSGKKNMSISNAAFSEKRGELKTSEIALNRAVARSRKWTRTEIEDRAKRFSGQALKAWPWDRDLVGRADQSAATVIEPARTGGSASRPSQLRLPIASRRTLGFPPISEKTKHAGSVWTPRIVWALEYARRHDLGPQTAAGLARILTTGAGFKVQSTNMARAFRAAGDATNDMWETTGSGYTLGTRGPALFDEMFESSPRERASAGARRAVTQKKTARSSPKASRAARQ